MSRRAGSGSARPPQAARPVNSSQMPKSPMKPTPKSARSAALVGSSLDPDEEMSRPVVAQALSEKTDGEYDIPAAETTMSPAQPAVTAAPAVDLEAGNSSLAVAETTANATENTAADDSELGAAVVSPYRFTPSEEALFSLRSTVRG